MSNEEKLKDQFYNPALGIPFPGSTEVEPVDVRIIIPHTHATLVFLSDFFKEMAAISAGAALSMVGYGRRGRSLYIRMWKKDYLNLLHLCVKKGYEIIEITHKSQEDKSK